jgi:FkbM family methyltransferase
MTTFEIQLEELLKKDPAQLASVQKAYFKKLTAENGERFVLFGSGHLGRFTLAGLRKAGVEPLAFADNNSKIWGKEVNGLKVISPQSVADLFGTNAVFVTTVYTSAPVRKQLTGMGLKVVSFASLAWQYPQSLTPHNSVVLPGKIFEQADDVRKALHLWADETSRREYLGQLLWHSILDESVLPAHMPQDDIYFADDLFTFVEDEVFCDCGAFDGDSVQKFLKCRSGAFGQIIAIEPDPENCRALASLVESLPTETGRRIKIIQSAAGSKREMVRFKVTGTVSSSVGEGDFEVQCAPLDELCDKKPTFIKMDIEGAEPDALLGASNIIKNDLPVLAVCLYHNQEHLWKIPLLIQSISSEYNFFLQRYSDECWELVCYAVPNHRLKVLK